MKVMGVGGEMDLEKEKDDVHLVRCCCGGDSINGITSDPTVDSAKMQAAKVYQKRADVKIFTIVNQQKVNYMRYDVLIRNHY